LICPQNNNTKDRRSAAVHMHREDISTLLDLKFKALRLFNTVNFKHSDYRELISVFGHFPWNWPCAMSRLTSHSGHRWTLSLVYQLRLWLWPILQR